MMALLHFCILLMASSAPVFAAPNTCPTVCDCNELLRVTNCRGGVLERIPWNLPDPSGLKELDMRENQVHSLTAQIVSYPNLEVLDLGQNELATIEDNVFDALSKLKMLSIRNNRLRILSPSTFHGLKSLLVLDLSTNQLETLEDGVFSGMDALQTLNLGQNRISNIARSAFENLSRLRHLTLTDNFLRVFPSSKGLLSLSSLYLDMNRIGTVPSRIFEIVPDIQLLNLDGNLISHVVDDAFETTRGCSQIRRLSLRDNLLTSVPRRAMACLTNLEVLDLSGSQFEFLTDLDFKGLQRLRALTLSNLPYLKVIRNGTFSAQLALRELNVHSNRQLSAIDCGSFANAVKLRRLDLHGNALEVLQQELVSNWDSLEFLDLRYNRWHCNCHMRWLIGRLAHTDSNGTEYFKLETRCTLPQHLSSRRISELSETDLLCDGVEHAEQLQERQNEDKILFGLLGGICGVLFLVMIFVMCKYKSSFLNPSSGTFPYAAYIHTSERQADIHPRAQSKCIRQERVLQANRQLSQSDEEPITKKERRSEVRFNVDEANPV